MTTRRAEGLPFALQVGLRPRRVELVLREQSISRMANREQVASRDHRRVGLGQRTEVAMKGSDKPKKLDKKKAQKTLKEKRAEKKAKKA
jgi:hypothetical protein